MKYKIYDLFNDCSCLSKNEGIYKVIADEDFIVKFNSALANTAHKPYGTNVLKQKYDATKEKNLLYVGKATNLRRRVKQYIDYAKGVGKTHKGGRAIFQIQDFENLTIEIIECNNSSDIEKDILTQYRSDNGVLPVANWRI